MTKLKKYHTTEPYKTEYKGIKITPEVSNFGLCPGYLVIDLKTNTVQNFCFSLHGLNCSIKKISGGGVPLSAIDPNKLPLMWDGAKLIELDPEEVANFSRRNRKPKSYADAGME